MSDKKAPVITRITSPEYTDIYNINCPITFYWTKTGFDGIEIGSMEGYNLTRHQKKLVHKLLERLSEVIHIHNNDIPTAFKQMDEG